MAALRCHQSLVNRGLEFLPLSSDECLDEFILRGGNDVTTQPPTLAPRTFIYSQGIPIPNGSMDPSAISSAILFNTGLAHQLMAQTTCDVRYQALLLHKAKCMYALTFQTQNSCCDNVIFSFAVRNNLAVVEQHMGRRIGIDESLGYLKSINQIVDRGCQFRLAHMESFWSQLPSTAETAPSA